LTERQDLVAGWIRAHDEELIELRRELHAHPELGYHEHRTTALIMSHLIALGLKPTVFPSGTGVLCDIGVGPNAVALRADIDALPIVDSKNVPYRSTVLGLCHACGHDVHTAALLGAAQVLVQTQSFAGRVRLIFQPAEEQIPGGAVEAVELGAVDDVSAVFALHCDPRLPVGRIGLRVGAITAACDTVEVRLSGPGGHTARPHLTADVVYAMGRVLVELPMLLSRRVDPRAGLSMVWGAVNAGVAANAIPESGVIKGTVRMLNRDAWDESEALVTGLIREIVAPTGAGVEIVYERGVPPVINDAGAVDVQRRAVLATLGVDGLATTEQSMGGEDFGWLTAARAGAYARLGVARPGMDEMDLHQSGFDIDERAVGIGAEFLANCAIEALADLRPPI
jgi:amidohydrolase